MFQFLVRASMPLMISKMFWFLVKFSMPSRISVMFQFFVRFPKSLKNSDTFQFLVRKGWDENNKAFKLAADVTLVFAVILAIVVIYNLQMLTFLEMLHDVIILKVLGFKDAVLAKILLSQGLFFIILGIILGTPISYYFMGLLWNSSSEKYYQVAHISPTNLLLTIGIILLVLIIVNIIFYYKIKRTDLVASTKIPE